MSSRLPRITAKELIRFVPVHAGKIIGPGLLKAILKQVGLDWDE